MDGFSLAPEWVEHGRTWLSWPRRRAVWPHGLERAEVAYEALIHIVSKFENVGLVVHKSDRDRVFARLADLENVTYHITLIDDSWIRDNGPSFLMNSGGELGATVWKFNGWGGKYQPFSEDAAVAAQLVNTYHFRSYFAPVVCEGGAIHGNGQDVLMTTESVLLNPNQNSGFTKKEITEVLCAYSGNKKILWVPHGLVGDETDDHIDNVACFLAPKVIAVATCDDPRDENYSLLNENLRYLSLATDPHGKKFEIVKIPLPPPIIDCGRRLTASYVNFIFLNSAIILPAFNLPSDDVAAATLRVHSGERQVIPFDARAICEGGGGPHCVTLNQPARAYRIRP